jgi:hypothetical protein
MTRRILLLSLALLALTPATASAYRYWTPTTLDFGSQAVGTTSAGKTATFNLQCSYDPMNPATCTGDTVVDPTATVTGPFSQTNACMNPMVAMNPAVPVQCTVTVKFSPTTPCPATGSVTIGGAALPLTGTGLSTSPCEPVTSNPPIPAATTLATKKKCKRKRGHKTALASKKRCKKRR